jgi:uncharacterized membrane protein YbhN (UPF0104 family)
MTARRLASRAAKLAMYLVVFGFLGYQLWRVRHGLLSSVRTIGLANVTLAGLLAGIGGVPGMLGWWLLLSSLGTRLRLPTALRLYFVAGLTRYVPGGVWPTVAHAAAARPLREPPARLASAFLASQALAVVAGLVIGLLALPRLIAGNPLWWLLLPVLLAALVPLAFPQLLAPLITRAARLLRRGTGPVTLPGPRVLFAATGLMALGWLISGAHVTVLAMALGAHPGPAIAVGIGGFALSVVASVATIVLPAGLGARELVLGATLATVVTGPSLVAVVALSRVIITVVDLLSTAIVLSVLSLFTKAFTTVPSRREEPSHEA